MQYTEIQKFINELAYDLDTIRYLLDYGRVKETIPILNKIWQMIETFQKSNPPLEQIFPEHFWQNQLPKNTPLSDIRHYIYQNANCLSSITDQDLDKIEYKTFIKKFFTWSDDSISKLRQHSKSPAQKNIEKIIFYFIILLIVMTPVIWTGYHYFTKNWGLKVDFYEWNDFKTPLFSAQSKTIDFYEDPLEMNPKLPHDNFCARWQGKLIAPQTGEYTIAERSDDGAKIFLDGKLLINDWGPHGPDNLNSTNTYLEQGPHRIKIEYYQLGGGATLRLFWSRNNADLKIISSKYLRN